MISLRFSFFPLASWAAAEINFNLKLIPTQNITSSPSDPVFCVSQFVCCRQRYTGCCVPQSHRWPCHHQPSSRCRGHGWHAGVTAQTAVPPELGGLPSDDGWLGQVLPQSPAHTTSGLLDCGVSQQGYDMQSNENNSCFHSTAVRQAWIKNVYVNIFFVLCLSDVVE